MIGDRVRSFREDRGWTQAHLAGASGVSERTVQRIETCHSYSGETAMALAAALCVEVRDLTAPDRSAPGEHRPLWPAPSPRPAALAAVLLTAPGAVIVIANSLRNAGVSSGPMGLLWSVAYAVGLVPGLWYLWPIPLILAPAIGIVLVLVSLMRIQGHPENRAITITGVEVQWHGGAVAAALLCLATMFAPTANMIGEMIAHAAQAPLD